MDFTTLYREKFSRGRTRLVRGRATLLDRDIVGYAQPPTPVLDDDGNPVECTVVTYRILSTGGDRTATLPVEGIFYETETRKTEETPDENKEIGNDSDSGQGKSVQRDHGRTNRRGKRGNSI